MMLFRGKMKQATLSQHQTVTELDALPSPASFETEVFRRVAVDTAAARRLSQVVCA